MMREEVKKMAKSQSYAGKIGNAGSQKVEAVFASAKKAKASVVKKKK